MYYTIFGQLVAVIESMYSKKISVNFVPKSFNEHWFLRKWAQKAIAEKMKHPLYQELVKLSKAAADENWRCLTIDEKADSWLAYNKYKHEGWA